MSVVDAKKTIQISEKGSTKIAILNALGDISDLEIFFNGVLVATRPRPRTSMLGGQKWYSSDDTVKEDQYQSKIGLVVKLGPDAFVDSDEVTFGDNRVSVGDWVVYTVRDGIQMIVNDVHCRLLGPTQLRGRVTNPDMVF